MRDKEGRFCRIPFADILEVIKAEPSPFIILWNSWTQSPGCLYYALFYKFLPARFIKQLHYNAFSRNNKLSVWL
jgi:hypothetical protein